MGRKMSRSWEDIPSFSIMTFGGEPMLALETVLTIHDMVRKIGITHRQILTNGNWIFTRVYC